MLQQNKIYKAAIYVRLSKEDTDISEKTESNSISNQKDLLKEFIRKQNNIDLVSERVDDGFSGVNFERPGFQAMLNDIKSGIVDCVIVKDLSRFGRNYIDTGRFIEKLFPMLGVRFIAVNDNFDSLYGKHQSDEIVIPFKNLINDAYCRDISIKIRSQFDVRRKKGEYVGAFTFFGYLKSQDDKNKLIVDDYAADIVRRIFKWKIAGMSQQRIADKLNQENVLSPAEYKKSLGMNYKAQFQIHRKAMWSAVAIVRILKNDIYLGTLVQGKKTTPNYKVKKIIEKDESEWIRIEENHQAIIEKSEFKIVQGLLLLDTRTSPVKDNVYLFSGIARCSDCGNTMTRKTTTAGSKKYIYYMCSTNKKGDSCSSHRIKEDDLEKAVLEIVRNYICRISDMDYLLQVIDTLPAREYDISSLDERIRDQEKVVEKNDRLKIAVYEDFKDGLIDKSEYLNLKEEFEQRREDAKLRVQTLKNEIESALNNKGVQHEWIENIKRYKDIHKLIRSVVVDLIDVIKVYEGNQIEVVFKHCNRYENMVCLIDRYIDNDSVREIR